MAASKHLLNVGQSDNLPSGYLTVRHRKSPFLIGKPSISMVHLYHGELLNNQMVPNFDGKHQLVR